MPMIYDDRIKADFQADRLRDECRPIGPLHYHPSYEIFVSLVDQMAFLINGQLFSLQYGGLILFTDQDLHQALPSRDMPYERLVMVFQPHLVWSLCSEQTNLLACFQETDISKRILQLTPAQMDRLLVVVQKARMLQEGSGRFGEDIRKRLLLAELLLDLNAWFQQKQPLVQAIRPGGEIEQVLTYIHRHLADPLSLDDLSGQFHRSKNRLNERFKAYTGKNIHQYIQYSRMAMACRCLLTGLSVKETAQACGCGNVSHFCRLFKMQTGQTPTQYARHAHMLK
ncbi:MAG: AraC family transcriptional regulator [Bacillota bacterium]|nr:AraC family transcriptional regulator [Bacillota bacterium]